MWATDPYLRVYTFVQNSNTNEMKWFAFEIENTMPYRIMLRNKIFKRNYIDDLSKIIYIYL